MCRLERSAESQQVHSFAAQPPLVTSLGIASLHAGCACCRADACACREDDFEVDAEEVGENEEEEEPWEYDSEALKHWEQFVKKSKATQVRSHQDNTIGPLHTLC